MCHKQSNNGKVVQVILFTMVVMIIVCSSIDENLGGQLKQISAVIWYVFERNQSRNLVRFKYAEN